MLSSSEEEILDLEQNADAESLSPCASDEECAENVSAGEIRGGEHSAVDEDADAHDNDGPKLIPS